MEVNKSKNDELKNDIIEDMKRIQASRRKEKESKAVDAFIESESKKFLNTKKIDDFLFGDADSFDCIDDVPEAEESKLEVKTNKPTTQIKELDVKDLYVGQQFKNYKELCVALGEQPLQGNSKVAQANNWRIYFSYEKSGHKYTITKIHSIAEQLAIMSIIDQGRKQNQQSTNLRNVMINLLAINNSPHMVATSSELFHLLGLFNQNYIEANRNLELKMKFAKKPSDKLVIQDFFTKTRRKFVKNVTEALEYLETNMFLIYGWSRSYKIYRHSDVDNPTLDDLLATAEEEEIIADITRKTLTEFKAKGIFNIYANNTDSDFWGVVNSRVHEALGCYKYMSVYVIHYNPESIWKYIKAFSHLEDVAKLNRIMAESVKKNSISAHERSTSNINWNALNSGIVKVEEISRYISGGYASAPDYVNLTQQCADEFIVIQNPEEEFEGLNLDRIEKWINLTEKS